MKKIILYARNRDDLNEMLEYDKATWTSGHVICVISDSKDLWGKNFLDDVILPPEKISLFEYDYIVLFGKIEMSRSLKKRLIDRAGIAEKKIVHYSEIFQFNSGVHSVDWSSIKNIKELRAALGECDDLNDIEQWYYKLPHRVINKYVHYLDVYNRHLSRFRGKDCVIVEVGVFKGGSMQMWKHWLGDKAQVIGVDIDEHVKEYEEDRIKIEIGSQSDREFWKYFREKYPRVDIFLDDGGHTMEQQIVTFEEMFPHISNGGVYLCEDLHTSYWDNFGGGYKEAGSFVEYSKNFIDYIHAWHSIQFEENQYTRSMNSIHYYNSMCVIEKQEMYPPVAVLTGME
ncbi:MAG: class I SAM-dependent methyltransferase [Lachnospiraceae bacterium]|nr:class I SAM-dependent methyltransferase [Lachnospiraceae bacterium]